MSSSEQVVNFLTIVHGKYILSSWMDEVFIDIVHGVVQYNIAKTKLLVVPKVLQSSIQILQYL